MNNIIEFYIKHEQKKYNNGGLNTSAVRIHLLDVWSISWQRRYEIPLPFKGDGLHWSCLSQKSRGNACEEEMGSIDDILNSSAIKSGKDEFYPQSSSLLGKPVLRAPDEVAWGAVQLMLLKLCNLS